MPSVANALMSFAEFQQLPEPHGGWLELHHGVPIEMPPPFHGHKLIQRYLRGALSDAAASQGIVETEVAFRPGGDYEYWIADVAFVSRDRWNAIPRRGILDGAPEVVVEVLSDSNTASEMFDKQAICLAAGSEEFWVVDPARRKVDVFTSAGRFSTYTPGQSIPLLFGGELFVDRIFDVLAD